MAEYIDRERLLSFERFDREVTGEGHTAENILMMIQTAPAADVAPVRHGRWMGTVCTACGTSVSFYYDCDYCPQCGAKMDGEE